MNNKPDNAILFLYEGDTEEGFYDTLFEKLGLNRNAQITKGCLQGNINQKVASKIFDYLQNKKHDHVNYLTVIVAYDREGDRTEPGRMNANAVMKKIKDKRLKGIHEIIATQMLESWFFIDMQGIYKYLKILKNKQKPAKYANTENFRHEDLNELFKKANKNKRYHKGESSKDLVAHLDLVKIYKECPDLKKGIDLIFKTAGLKIHKDFE